MQARRLISTMPYTRFDNSSSGASTVQFSHDFMGRVSGTQYTNGDINRYQYDALGNRSSIDFSSGGAVRYTHDAAGNIVEVVVTERHGEQKRQEVRIGDMNRVENITYEGMGSLDVVYDEMGRAVSFDTGGDVISVEYAGPDRIGRIASQATGATWSPKEDGASERKARDVMDTRREVLQNDSAGATHPDYGIVAFHGTSFAVEARDPMDLGVQGLSEARRVLAVAEPLISSNEHSAMMDFEKPSNAVFQPLEYRSTNCCVCIIIYPRPSALRSHSALRYHDDGETRLTCICLPVLSPPPSIRFGLGKGHVWPQDTGQPAEASRATITVSSSDVPQGTAVSIRLELRNDGGHVRHSGPSPRPLGTVTPQNIQIDAQGNATALFTASHYGGDIDIRFTVGELSETRTLQVRVPNLYLMSAGNEYNLIGAATEHPRAWYATYAVRGKLKSIAKAYKKKYYPSPSVQPTGERVGYNDMSLVYGGKFEIDGDWCTECDGHEEHRVGTHVDARRWNMTSTQHEGFMEIVADNSGSPEVHDKGTANEHWHLVF